MGAEEPGEPGEHRHLRELLGAYALDQLAADERVPVREHLAGCAACRSELDGLRGVAVALRGLDPESLSPVEPVPPAELADAVVARVRARRRAAARRARVRRAVTGFAVAAGVAAAFALGGAWTTRDAPTVVPVALRVVPASVQAQAGVVRHTWGTELDLQASGLDDGGAYTVVFLTRDGTRVPAGGFTGTGPAPLHCRVNAAVSLDAAAEVEITDADGTLVMDAPVR